MYPDHLHSNCRLLFRIKPVTKFPHGLYSFGDARFRRHHGTLLLKQTGLVFVPEDGQRILHLSRNQMIEYKVFKKGKDLRISVLYHMLLFSGSVSETVRRYYFLVKNSKKEDWQL